MGKIAEKYLQYGIESDIAIKYENDKLSVTTYRATSIDNLLNKYGIENEEAKRVKKCIQRQPINIDVVQKLLDNSNYVCCCCKGMKSDSFIIHHLEKYEVSQDNSYDNLAVLCLNDHDLAHRETGISNKLTIVQIKRSKTNWEKEVKAHNIGIAKGNQLENILAKLPIYKHLEEQIIILKNSICDKEKIIERSESYFDIEILDYKSKIKELERQKKILENQVAQLALQIDKMDMEQVSKKYQKALNYFLEGNITKAISELNDADLQGDYEKNITNEKELCNSYKQNADSWILRSQLLTIQCDYNEANESAVKGLELYDKLCSINFDEYIEMYIEKIEQVGSVFYNINDYQNAVSLFEQGVQMGLQLCEDNMNANAFTITKMIQNIGACYYSMNEPEKSLKYLNSALFFFEKISSTESYMKNPVLSFDLMHIVVLSNLGQTYMSLKDSQKSLEAYLLGVSICERLFNVNLDDEMYYEAIFRNLNGLGMCYFYEKNNYDEAQKTFLKALPYGIKIFEKREKQYINELADLYHNICATYFFQENYLEVIKYSEMALQCYNQIGNELTDKVAMQKVDTLLYKMIGLFKRKKDMEDIDKYLDEALELCSRYPNNHDAQKYPGLLKSMYAKFCN